MVRHHSVRVHLRLAQAGHRLVRVDLHTGRVEHWAVDATPVEFHESDNFIPEG